MVNIVLFFSFFFEMNSMKTIVDKQYPDSDRGISGGEGNEIDLDQTNENSATGKPSSGIESNHNPSGNDVFIMDNRGEDRTASFFAQPGILAGMLRLIYINS